MNLAPVEMLSWTTIQDYAPNLHQELYLKTPSQSAFIYYGSIKFTFSLYK